MTDMEAKKNTYRAKLIVKAALWLWVFAVVLPVAAQAQCSSNLKATNLSSTGLTLQWNDLLGGAYPYKVYNGSMLIGTTAAGATSYPVTGLTSNYDYTFKVVADCATCGCAEMTVPVHTPCPGTLPYLDAFDNYGVTYNGFRAPSGVYPNDPLPTCWYFPIRSVAYNQYPEIFLSRQNPIAKAGAALCSKTLRPAMDAYMVLCMDFNVPFSSLSFSWSSHWSYVVPEFGYMSNPADPTTFVALGTMPAGTTQHQKQVVRVADYAAQLPASGKYYIAFHNRYNHSGSSYWGYFSLDSVQVWQETVVCPPTDSVFNITACDRYTWVDDITYTQSTSSPSFVVPNACGADSTVSLHLTINHSYAVDTIATACDQFTWHGTTYTSTPAVAPTHVYRTAGGCDSTATLRLTVNASDATDTTAVECDGFVWYGTTYTASATPTHTLVNAAGCDSVLRLDLTVLNSSRRDTAAVVCDEFTWYGTTYTTTSTPSVTTTNAVGCDSTVYLDLTVKHSSQRDTTAVMCDTFTWYGTTYTTTGDPSLTLTNAVGCDSVVTLHLTINQTAVVSQTETVCDSLEWHGEWRKASGEYDYHTTTAEGCDSTVVLSLTVNRSGRSEEAERGCDSVEWHGGVYREGGDYEYRTRTVGGCDSTLTLHLTLGYASAGDTAAEVCDGLYWYGQQLTGSGEYESHRYRNREGCDSALTLHLTVRESTGREFRRSVCDTVTWHGVLYGESCEAVHVGRNAAGCDSVETLRLTVNHRQTVDTFATACDRFEWYGEVYENDNVVRRVWPDANGCDSMVFLILTVRYSTQSVVVDTVVENELPHRFLGREYSRGVTGQRLTTGNAVGCDSVVEYTLVVMENREVEYTSTVCRNHLPMGWNGQTIGGAGDYTARLRTVHGADSTVRLHLRVAPSYRDTVVDHACNGESVYYRGEGYRERGVYEIMYSTAEGCDSLVVLDLRTHEFRAAVKALPDALRSDRMEYRVHDVTGGEVVRRRWYVNWEERPGGGAAMYSGEAGPTDDSVVVSLVASSAYCEDSTAVVIPVYHTSVYAPNAFTPLEEYNNRFTVRIEDAERVDFAVYDRDGRRMYHSEDLSEGWDGRAPGGQYCQQGSYVWRLEYTTADQPTRRQVQVGQVLLLR